MKVIKLMKQFLFSTNGISNIQVKVKFHGKVVANLIRHLCNNLRFFRDVSQENVKKR